LSYPVQSKLRLRGKRYYNTWYQQLLTKNPRVSLRSFGHENYEQLFMTGILKSEADDFIRWFNSINPGFCLPTTKQWKDACKWLSGYEAVPEPPKHLPMNQGAQSIWRGLSTACKPDKLQNQALLDRNILEYVLHEPSRVQAFTKPLAYTMGTPRSDFHPNTRSLYDPPSSSDFDNRLEEIGFRLIRTEK